MGTKKEEKKKKEKKEKKAKKEKKEKKKKRQKVDHDDIEETINDTINENKLQKNHDDVDGLPPGFYESKEEEGDVKIEHTSATDMGDADDNEIDTPASDADAIATGEEGATATTAGKRKRKRKRKRKTDKSNDSDDDNDDGNDGERAGATFDESALVQDTIFVEGIPFEKTRDEVREFFVDEHGIPSEDILELRLPTWQDTGRLRGYGHIRFASTESYNKALGLNRKYMGKRYLSIQPAKSSTGSRSGRSIEDPSIECPDGCVTIFVNNLPYEATEDQIAAVFSKHAPNSSIAEDGVRIARNSMTRQSKGFAYIDFETSKDAKRLMKAAVKKNVLLGGRIIRLDYDTGRIKGSFRTASGQLLNKNHED